MRRHVTIKFVSAALFLSAVATVGGSLAAQEVVAFVESVSGQVVAFSQGRPTLLEALDTINHRTQLNLPQNSELRVCHYRTGKIVSLKGPLRATVSQDGVTVENSKVALAALGPCAAPAASTVQGGIVTRGVSDQAPAKDTPKQR